MNQRLRILVVDDDSAIRDFLTMALADEGYEVAAVADGLSAFGLTDDFQPNLIILDMLMPAMTGPEFIAAYGRKPHPAPIIGMSAKTLSENFAQVLGIADFLYKPFDLNVLLQRVKTLIQ